jgi:hypothetical protein
MKNLIEKHKRAATHLEEAAKHHHEAAKHHEEGNHEKAHHSTVKANGHSTHAAEIDKEILKHHVIDKK